MTDPHLALATLQHANATLQQERDAALAREAALAEVLGVINASPGNPAPVFDAMLEKAMRLCGAAFGSLYVDDGEHFNSAAQHGVPSAYAAFRAKNPIAIDDILPASHTATRPGYDKTWPILPTSARRAKGDPNQLRINFKSGQGWMLPMKGRSL